MIGTRSMAGTSTVIKPREPRVVSATMYESWVGYAILAAIAIAILIESLLAVRLWAELTSQDVTSGVLRSVYSLTNGLVEPFLPAESATSVRTTGIFEVATLTAIEVYLVGSFFVLAALLFLRITFHHSALRYERQLREAAFGDESALAAQAASIR